MEKYTCKYLANKIGYKRKYEKSGENNESDKYKENNGIYTICDDYGNNI